METNNTEKNRTIRKNHQMQLNDSNIMITIKEAKQILQENFVAYKNNDKTFDFTLLGMDDKNNLFTIKRQLEEVNQDTDSMKTKLIEVRFTSYKSDYSEYSHEYETETIYESVGLFDNIDTAWKIIHQKIAKYHTNLEQYTFRMIEINKSHKSYGEDEMLQKHQQKLRELELDKIDDATKGFQCSECEFILKIEGMSRHTQRNYESSHGQTHKKGGSWQHVNWTRIMKEEVSEK